MFVVSVEKLPRNCKSDSSPKRTWVGYKNEEHKLYKLLFFRTNYKQ